MNQIFQETRMFWLSDGEEIMTLAFFVLIHYRSVTDRRTDGQTDIPALVIPAGCIARYVNALVKTLSRIIIHSYSMLTDCFCSLEISFIADFQMKALNFADNKSGSPAL